MIYYTGLTGVVNAATTFQMTPADAPIPWVTMAKKKPCRNCPKMKGEPPNHPAPPPGGSNGQGKS